MNVLLAASYHRPSRTILIIALALCTASWVACGGSSGGSINTIAGKNVAGFQGDGGAATNAHLNTPTGVGVDSTGNIYIADSANNRIRKVSSGNITTIAGNGNAAFTGDGAAATAASFNQPVAVAIDGSGNIFVVDQLNNAVRKITSAGVISTIAGTGTAGYNGDNIAASTAQLYFPTGVAVDANGNIYIADLANNRIREITAASGLITTVVGTGVAGYAGDSGAATAAQLSAPSGVALSKSGDLYIVDQGNNVVRKVTSGTISTVAGTGAPGNTGDGGKATAALLSNPYGIAVDSTGNFYISDVVNNRVRKVGTDGNISNAAGNGVAGFKGDGHSATAAEVNGPHGLAIDSKGNLFIADTRNQVIREVTF
jgi:trimeric autotransporter adhesin